MTDPVLVALYALTAVQLVFQAGVFVYAYRVSRITGSFRAWTMIIASFALLTVGNIVSLVLSLSLPSDQLSSLLQSIGPTTILFSSAVNLFAGAALFFGFFGLVKRFQTSPKGP